MKNRARTISLLIAVCMMITLLPAVALAAGEATSVKIGGVELNNTNKWYVNGANGAPGIAYNSEPDSWNAKFENGTLTLKGLNIVNVKKDQPDAKGIWWDYSLGDDDLTIVLQGENIVTNTRGAAIVGDSGFSTGPSLTIQGDGTLFATGSSSGIWVWQDITIGGSAKVYATGVTKYGIACNISAGTITIKDNAQVIADGARADSTQNGMRYGIGCERDDNATINIEGGRLTAFGADGAIQKGVDSCYKNSVTVAENVNGDNLQEVSWNSLSDTYKYAAVGDALTLPKYYVFFDRNVNPSNPNPNAPAMVAQSVTSGSLTLSNYTGLSGDTFVRWDTKDSGTGGTSYANEATLVPIRSMILYARNDDITTYSVTFYAGEGGSGTMAEVKGISGKYLLPFNSFIAPTGKQFKAWSIGDKEYAENDVITVSNNITVTAVWEDIPNSTPDDNTGGGTGEGTTPPTVNPSSGIDVWYNGGNSFGTSKSAVPTAVEIDGVPVSFTGNGSEFTVGCISPNAKRVTVNWNSTSVTTNFTPDANAYCTQVQIPKTGDMPFWTAIAEFFGF